MKAVKMNQDWKFWCDRNSFALVWDIPEAAQTVELPHDAMIDAPAHADSRNGGNTGFRDGDNYTYVKLLEVPAEYRDKTVMLKFEGVYMNALVYVNGQMAAHCPYGYTGFYVQLNDFLRYGEQNEIRVQVKNSAMTNSRWYSGSGIYRDVYLLVSDTVYIEPEQVRVTTESLDGEYAVLTVDTSMKNRRYNRVPLRLETELLDADGRTAAKDTAVLTLFEQESRVLTQRMAVESPAVWSEETPVLYRCVSRLYEGETLLDEQESTFGIRTLSVDAKRGLRVNGRTVKLRGACIHHDNGMLGAVTTDEVERRRIRILKEAGFNAIRMSHHPASPALLRACDALGMYVMDETFDMWTRGKSDNDYSTYFDKWWEEDARAMVHKDYNHPSVILYSVGNEIPEIGTEHGAAICHDICAAIKAEDPTRLTLASINGVFAAGDRIGEVMADIQAELAQEADGATDGNVNDFMTMMDQQMDRIVTHRAVSERLDSACAYTDIAGYNYMTARYEPDGDNYPNRVIVGSETYPPEIARNWELVERLPHVIGDFTWTGWDYIGEAGVGVVGYQFGEGGFGAQFPCQLAYCGDIDITGVRRPASYFREIVFGFRKDPYITVQDPAHYGQQSMKTVWVLSDNRASWTWPGFEGKPVVAEIYAPGDEVELFKNHVSIARVPAGKEAGYRVFVETSYELGELEAVAYENGEIIGRSVLSTAAVPQSLTIREEKIAGDAIGALTYYMISNEDENGVVYDAGEVKLSARVSDNARILAFGSANPKTSYDYHSDVTETFLGRAQLIVQRTGEGEICVEVKKED